jgi:N-acetylmuramoyl-L-alanine amidase
MKSIFRLIIGLFIKNETTQGANASEIESVPETAVKVTTPEKEHVIIPLYEPLVHPEPEKFEDEDEVELPIEKVEEDAPVCKEEEALRQFVRNARITRRITHLVVHCTATQPTATITAIQRYWRETKGWKSPGYHIILPQEGFTSLLDFNGISNGASGYNQIGVHISYIGGIDKNGKALDTRTATQTRLINAFIEEMKLRIPNIKIIGHNEIANKACPSFRVKDSYPQHWTGK